MKPCKNCKKEIIGRGNNAKYCSKKCANENYEKSIRRYSEVVVPLRKPLRRLKTNSRM